MHESNQQYVELIRDSLGKTRFHHSLCVSAASVRLAEKYGYDTVKAECAGLLHDIMKEASQEEQLTVIRAGGYTLCAVEEKTPKLLHAIAGAAYAKTKLGIHDGDILRPIRYHTTGRAGMTLPEKILYLADYISDERDYDGVEVMRAAAGKGLHKAIFTGLAFSIRDLSQRGGAIHPDTMNAYNELILSGETNGQPPLL